MITKAVTHFAGSAAVERVCWCGIHFAIPSELDSYYRRSNERGDQFAIHCPLGHSMVPSKPDAEKRQLRDEIARTRAQLDQEKARADGLRRSLTVRERQVAARKAVATKLRKRIAAGKCPCCHAQFKNLQQHMKAKHPRWNPEQAAEAIAAKQEG